MKRAFLAALLAGTAVPAYPANIAVHMTDFGQVISIDGQIGPNDFDVFKAKASPVSGRSVVFLTSTGGNLVAALQIGEFIRLRGWATIVPSQCYSACALIWLAGVERMMPSNAKIGFHAASMNGQEKGMGNALIGAYLNRLGLGYEAVLFATAAGPEDITYLTPSEAKRVGIDVHVIDTQPTQPAQQGPLGVIPKTTPAGPEPDARATSQQAENEALFLVRYINATQSNNHDQRYNNAKIYSDLYWDNVMYFGKMMSKSDILADKQKYVERWPNRTYTIKSITPAKCSGTEGNVTECEVSGVIDFEATSQTKRSVGSASFEYTFRPWPLGSWNSNAGRQVGLRIAVEGGKVLTRQVTDLNKPKILKPARCDIGDATKTVPCCPPGYISFDLSAKDAVCQLVTGPIIE